MKPAVARNHLKTQLSRKPYIKKRSLDHDRQGPDFDDMSPFFPYKIDEAIQYTNLGYGAQAPKIVILQCIFSYLLLLLRFR